METFDTVIIGAGPGGLRCAAVLAERGVKTLVLERNPVVGPKVCAGGIPSHAWAELDLPPELQEGSFPTQLISTPWQQARVHFSEPVITTINRQRLGTWQLHKAQQAGAIIRTSTTVTAINDKFIETTSSPIAYRTLVGADGSASLVRRHLGLESRRLGVGINYQVPGRWPDMEWHLNPKLFNSGYAWIFPHRQVTSVGAYAERNDLTPATLHRRFLAWAKTRGLDLAGIKAQAALINFDFQGWNFNPIFLVGDAAGLASGFTGEGIYPAILSGDTVARTILDPSSKPLRLNAMLQRHTAHRRLQKFYTGRKVICQISLEMLVLALRMKLIGFEALEMY